MQVLTLAPQQSATTHMLAERVIVGFERAFQGNDSELTREPDAVNLLQGKVAIKPAKVVGAYRPPLGA